MRPRPISRRMFLPYYLWNSLAMYWISAGRAAPVLSDVGQLIVLPQILRACVVGLLKPVGQKFKVTAKGGDRSRRFVEWGLMRPFLVLLIFTVARDPQDLLLRRPRRRRLARGTGAVLVLVQYCRADHPLFCLRRAATLSRRRAVRIARDRKAQRRRARPLRATRRPLLDWRRNSPAHRPGASANRSISSSTTSRSRPSSYASIRAGSPSLSPRICEPARR